MSAGRERLLSARFLVAVVVYAALIFIVSQIPGKELARFGFGIWDKAIHAALYLPFGAMIMAWLLARRGSRDPGAQWRALGVAAGLVLGYGALDEVHQAFVPGRQPSCADAVADVIGGTVGALAALVIWRRSAGRGPKPLGELEAGEEEQPVELLAGDPGDLDDRRDRE